MQGGNVPGGRVVTANPLVPGPNGDDMSVPALIGALLTCGVALVIVLLFFLVVRRRQGTNGG
jgi:hypothetical protein